MLLNISSRDCMKRQISRKMIKWFQNVSGTMQIFLPQRFPRVGSLLWSLQWNKWHCPTSRDGEQWSGHVILRTLGTVIGLRPFNAVQLLFKFAPLKSPLQNRSPWGFICPLLPLSVYAGWFREVCRGLKRQDVQNEQKGSRGRRLLYKGSLLSPISWSSWFLPHPGGCSPSTRWLQFTGSLLGIWVNHSQ